MIINPTTFAVPTPAPKQVAPAPAKPAEESPKAAPTVKNAASDHTDISEPEGDNRPGGASSIGQGVSQILDSGSSAAEKGLGSLKSMSGGLSMAGHGTGAPELSAAGHKIGAAVDQAHSSGPFGWFTHAASSVGDAIKSGVSDGVHGAEKLGDKIGNAASSVGKTINKVTGGSDSIGDLAKEAKYMTGQGLNMAKNKLFGPPGDDPLPSDAKKIVQQDGVKSAADVTDPGQRSKIAYDALKANMGGGNNLEGMKGGHEATAWTYGQTMVASLDQAKQTGNYKDFDALAKGLAKYKEPSGGYAPGTNGVSGMGNCYFDDNSWIGLAFMQAHNQLAKSDPKQASQYLNDAKSTFNFVKTGQTPEGGVVWAQNQKAPTYNTCTEGPATELAMQLHMATAADPKDMNDEYGKFATQVYNNMQQNLLIKSGPNAGLYADHVDLSDPSKQNGNIYSYNQGTPVGAATLMYKATGDTQYLDQAKQTANASVKYYSQGDNLMKQAPAFNAIYMRNLLQLDTVAPNPQYKELLTNYNNQVWQDKLNPQSGLFDKPSDAPMGRYGGNPTDVSTLDQAALVQLNSLQAMQPSSYSDLT